MVRFIFLLNCTVYTKFMQVKLELCVYILKLIFKLCLRISGFSQSGDVLGDGVKVNTTESLSQTTCGLCTFR